MKNITNAIPKAKDLFTVEYNSKGLRRGIKINHKSLIENLYLMGFRRWDINGNFIFAKLESRVIAEVSVTDIQDAVIDFVKSQNEIIEGTDVDREELLQKFFTSPGIYFNEKKFSLLKPDEALKINSDTKDSAFIYFSNGFVICSKDGYTLNKYEELKYFVRKSQIIERDFDCQSSKSQISEMGIFARFCFNISFKEQERFQALKTIIGYLLHSYFDLKLKAINITDSKIQNS